ncbi:hypothetical protein Tco_1024205 [Tanacetum coccineum]
MLNTNTNLQTQTSNDLHNTIIEAGGKDHPPMLAPVSEGSSKTTTNGYMENYKIVSQDIQDQLNANTKVVQIILTGIDNDIYSIVDACPNACEMWKALERLKQSESINVQDLETNLYWEFGKFTSRDGESPELYYLRKRGNEIINSSTPTYDQEPEMVTEDDTLSKEKEIDKLMALISLSFNKIYKPTNKNLRTSSNISRANQGNTPRINRGTRYDSQRVVNVARARENIADWRDDTDDEPKDQELEAHYMYMEQIQEVTLDVADNFGPIFDAEPLQKQPESVNDTYSVEQDEHNMIIDSLDISYDREQVDYDDDDLAKEHDLLASLIEKLKYEIDDSKNRNKFLETSNKALVDKLKGEIEDFKTKNKSLESSNNHFKEANNELSKTNQLMFKDLKKFQAELDRYHDVNYASKVAIDCAKAKGDLMSYKMESEKSFNEYTRKINDLNQTISEMKKELFAHQETISIMSQEKEAQIKFYKTREDKEIEKVIALENKVKALDDIVYKTGQSVQTMNMLNRNCKTSFVKPEFLKKAQRANPRLYDIGCYNDNLALMLAPESDETIRLAQESRSKLSDLIRPFDYKNLNNLYDLFVPQREKSSEQRYFSERINADLEKFHLCLKEEMVVDLRYFNSLEHEVDSLKSQLETQKTQFLNEIDQLSKEYCYADHINAILGVYTTLNEFTDLQCDYVDQVVKCERLEKELSKNLKAQLQDKGIAISEVKKLIEKMKGKSVKTKFEKPSVIRQPNAFKSQRQSILGKPATFSDSLAKTDFSKLKSVTTNNVSNDFLKPVTAQTLPQNVKSILKNTNVIAPGMYKVHTKPNQTRTPQLPQDIRNTNKRVSFSTGVISTTMVSRPQLKINQLEDRVIPNNSQGKKKEIEDHRLKCSWLCLLVLENSNEL